MGSRIEHSVQVKCNPQRAWEIYTDWKRWRSWNELYSDIRWVEGEPWVTGSRMEVDVLQPRPMTAKQVLTVCEPPRKVAWVGHGMGVTYEQWVNFTPRRVGGTLVYVWIELTGIATQFFGKTIEETVREILGKWFEAFRAECDLGFATEGQRPTSPQR
jgi:carbon monoxide dehydrogenase subunit G